MKITIDEQEIKQAVVTYIGQKVKLSEDSTISIDFTAGRGERGLTADIDIQYMDVREIDLPKPQREAAVAEAAEEVAEIPEAIAAETNSAAQGLFDD